MLDDHVQNQIVENARLSVNEAVDNLDRSIGLFLEDQDKKNTKFLDDCLTYLCGWLDEDLNPVMKDGLRKVIESMAQENGTLYKGIIDAIYRGMKDATDAHYSMMRNAPMEGEDVH